MKSVKFPGANIEMAKDQPQYNSIHMKAFEGPEAEVIACYEFSDEEIEQIVKTKRIWYSRLRFAQLKFIDKLPVMVPNPMQPFRIWPVTEDESVLIDFMERTDPVNDNPAAP